MKKKSKKVKCVPLSGVVTHPIIVNTTPEVFELSYIETHSTIESVEETTTKKMTDPYMTSYEYAKLISVRAEQIAKGDPIDPRIEWTGLWDPIAIATYEIEQRVCPLIIQRKIPDQYSITGYKLEEWSLKEIHIRDF